MNKQASNFNEAILQAMNSYARQPCFKVKRGARYHDISYWRFQILTLHMVHFFRDQDLSNGERVAIVADNSLEWMVTYMACLLAGGVAVPLRVSYTPETVRSILADSGASLAVLQDEKHIQALSTDLNSDTDSTLPHLKTILAINNDDELPPGVTELNHLLGQTAAPTSEEQELILAHAAAIPPEAPAVIHYVVSEAGQPKGAVFDHGGQSGDHAAFGRMVYV